MARIRSVTRSDLKEFGEEIAPDEMEMVAGAPPEPTPPSDPIPPEEEFAVVQPVITPAAPPPTTSDEELAALVARLQSLRVREIEVITQREEGEQRAEKAAEEVRDAAQANRHARFDLMKEPTPEREARAAATKERLRLAYDNEAEAMEDRALFEPVLQAIRQEIQALAKQVNDTRVARLRARLEARQEERSAELLRNMAEALVLHEIGGGFPIEWNNFGPLLAQSIGHDKSVTESARLLREQEGLA